MTARVPWWVCTSLYPGGYVHPCTPLLLYHPGYTIIPPLVMQLLPVTLRCTVTMPWAQDGRFPWVGASLPPSSPKGVTEGGRDDAQSAPLFPQERCERLDNTRVTPHVSPMVREVSAQRSSRPSIRSLKIVRESIRPFLTVLCRIDATMGLYPRGCSSNHNVDIPVPADVPRACCASGPDQHSRFGNQHRRRATIPQPHYKSALKVAKRARNEREIPPFSCRKEEIQQ